MRRIRFFSLGCILLQIFMLTAVGVASTPQALMRLDKPVHMLTADGADLLLEPGDYTLNPADDWIKVTPLSGTALDSWLMHTQVGTHQEALKGVRAFSVQGESPDSHHILLLLPDGKKFETIGTYSGIRSRGGFSGLSALRIKELLKDQNPHNR